MVMCRPSETKNNDTRNCLDQRISDFFVGVKRNLRISMYRHFLYLIKDTEIGKAGWQQCWVLALFFFFCFLWYSAYLSTGVYILRAPQFEKPWSRWLLRFCVLHTQWIQWTSKEEVVSVRLSALPHASPPLWMKQVLHLWLYDDNDVGGTVGHFNPYPTVFPYGNGMVLHFYQQQESSTTKTVHKVINKRLKTYV